MSNLFEFQGQELRFVGTPEAPEWVASDVISILYPGSRRENLRNYLSKVPDEWKGNKRIITLGGKQTVATLFEPGLYWLIARSDSPIAVRFQKWVFSEVLPSIRRTGSYAPKENTEIIRIHLELQISAPSPSTPGRKRISSNDFEFELVEQLFVRLSHKHGWLKAKTVMALSRAFRDRNPEEIRGWFYRLERNGVGTTRDDDNRLEWKVNP